jgi:sulfite reductase (ferredoxin)
MSWKEQLAGKIPRQLADEIDVYETQLELRKLGKIDEKLFAETRLRRGAYGQRYDNGQRHDGTTTQQLKYPAASLTKGPDTMWDAPGMQRIKIPFGGLTPAQLETLADCAEEYSDSILHVTTRQDFQLHFVHIEDTPSIMRRLASAGITTREACGNSIRNVTACPLAGVCRTEAFDVTPYAKATAYFLLGHPDTQDFGRKFKIAFSGCEQEACGLVNMHDLGALALIRDGNRGFRLYVGGGLGPVPYQAKVFADFVPEEELLPIAQAIARVFARLGEKQNRSRARIKFLVAKLGVDEFKRLVMEERKILPQDPRWTAYISEAHGFKETALKPPASLNGAAKPEGYAAWAETNVYYQVQPGYAVATISLPIGDLTSSQARRLADLARKHCGENIRTTVEQNLVLRWVAEKDLPELYRELKAIGLGDFGAGTILDVVACPGTDTCKLGIASSRGLARELRQRLAAQYFNMDAAVKGLRIKMSGCFNSCGQHHLADIGFYGNSRTVGNRKVPHFQVLLGGRWRDNAGSYGLAIGSVPSKNVPAVVERITQRFVKERKGNESFQDFITRIGKGESRKMLEDLMEVPAYELSPALYSDWGDPREFTMGDMGTGECAGEVVSRLDFDLQAAERLCFEAQLKLEAKDLAAADELAYGSMLQAAQGLVKELWYDVPNDPDVIAKEFRARLFEPKLFWDPFVGGKFAHDFFRRHENPPTRYDHDEVHRLIEESQLFIEAAHACADKLREQKAAQMSQLLK